MISRLALLGIASFAIVASPAAAVGKKKDVSWGKPGIAFDIYRSDALECANRAYAVQVEPRPVESLGTGWNAIALPVSAWTSLTPGRVMVYTTTLVEGYRHAVRFDTVTQLQAAVDSCLEQRGYHRFRLTPGQMSMLRALPPGTPERQHYLHSLGANAQVLSAQRL